MSKNLWGDLSELPVLRSPKRILKEQANALTMATRNVLVGNVSERNNFSSFGFNLDVKIPTLNNYVYTVLTHPLELYPVRVVASKPQVDVSCDNEQDFEAALQSILGSDEIRNVLARLRSLAA